MGWDHRNHGRSLCNRDGVKIATSNLSIILVIIATFIGAIGSLCLKLGANNLSFKPIEIIKNKFLIIGVLLYGLSSPLALIALKGGELSVLYPLVSLSYIWIILFSMKFLNEKMNVYKVLGITTIIISVVLIGLAA